MNSSKENRHISKSAKYINREKLTVTDGKVILTDTPSEGAVVNVFAANDNCGESLEVTVTGKEVTIIADPKCR